MSGDIAVYILDKGGIGLVVQQFVFRVAVFEDLRLQDDFPLIAVLLEVGIDFFEVIFNLFKQTF